MVGGSVDGTCFARIVVVVTRQKKKKKEKNKTVLPTTERDKRRAGRRRSRAETAKREREMCAENKMSHVKTLLHREHGLGLPNASRENNGPKPDRSRSSNAAPRVRKTLTRERYPLGCTFHPVEPE